MSRVAQAQMAWLMLNHINCDHFQRAMPLAKGLLRNRVSGLGKMTGLTMMLVDFLVGEGDAGFAASLDDGFLVSMAKPLVHDVEGDLCRLNLGKTGVHAGLWIANMLENSDI